MQMLLILLFLEKGSSLWRSMWTAASYQPPHAMAGMRSVQRQSCVYIHVQSNSIWLCQLTHTKQVPELEQLALCQHAIVPELISPGGIITLGGQRVLLRQQRCFGDPDGYLCSPLGCLVHLWWQEDLCPTASSGGVNSSSKWVGL